MGYNAAFEEVVAKIMKDSNDADAAAAKVLYDAMTDEDKKVVDDAKAKALAAKYPIL